MEHFSDHVFLLADLETGDWGPPRQLATGFSRASCTDAAPAFLRFCHDVLTAGLSSGWRLSLFFLGRDALSDDFGSMLRPKEMETHVLSASHVAEYARG